MQVQQLLIIKNIKSENFFATLKDLFSVGVTDLHLNQEFTVSTGFYNTFSKIYEEIQLCFIDHQNYLEAPALNL